MRKVVTILFSSCLMLFLSLPVDASVVGWNCNDDGDGAIVINHPVLAPTGDDYLLVITGAQYGMAGDITGNVLSDSPGIDPTISVIEEIENDTTFAWTDYHIAIGMNKTFSILNTGLLMPDGWTAVITAPSPGTTPSGGTGWVGMVDYYQGAGDPVAIGDEGLFGFKVSFLGSTQFCTQQNPSPEPATICLLGLGALSLLRKCRA